MDMVRDVCSILSRVMYESLQADCCSRALWARSYRALQLPKTS